jgi:hypothetical protein
MDMNVGNPDKVGDKNKRNDDKLIIQVVPRHHLRHNEVCLEIYLEVIFKTHIME